MAHQALQISNGLFDLELHGVRTRDAKRAIMMRLAESYRYGLKSLRCSYGSPDVYEGSILQTIREIVGASEYIRLEELPDWILDDKLSEPVPVFLTIPLLRNPAPDPLNEEASFEGFAAEHEMNRGQRLLCEMTYQPLRKGYDWKYAARAIKRQCSEHSLREMCRTLKINSAAEGLTLPELLQAAVAWEHYRRTARTSSSLKKPIEGVPPSTQRFVGEESPEPIFVPFANLPDAKASLLSIERFIDRGEYEQALQAIERALAEADESYYGQLSLCKGRVLLLQDDPACETWLLRADRAITATDGDQSVKRLPALRALSRWYMQSGEAEREVQCIELMAGMLPDSPHSFSTVTEFRMRLSYARLLRNATQYELSSRETYKALFRLAPNLSRCLEDLRASRVPVALIAKALMLLLEIAYEVGEVEESWAHLHALDVLIGARSVPGSLRAQIANRRAALMVQSGKPREAIDLYKRSLKLLNPKLAADAVVEYEARAGLAKTWRDLRDTDRAMHSYGLCLTLAERLGYQDKPHYALLTIDYSRVLTERREFEEALRTSQMAHELLILKRPSAQFDIAHALICIAEALDGLGQHDGALSHLKEAEAHLPLCAGSVPSWRILGLSGRIKAAESKSRPGEFCARLKDHGFEVAREGDETFFFRPGFLE